MLTGIGLRNFKAFGDEMQEAPLSKITLIYGPNSGGKSSIIQALLLLKQSLRAGYGRGRSLEPNGVLVDLGSTQAMLHKHSRAAELGMSIRYRNLNLSDDSVTNIVRMTFDGESGSAILSRLSYVIVPHEDDRILLNASLLPDGAGNSWDTDLTVMNLVAEKVSFSINSSFLPILKLSEFDKARNQELGLQHDHERWLEMERFLQHRRIQSQQIRFSIGTRRQVHERILALRSAQVREQAWAQAPIPALERSRLSSEEVLALMPENIPSDYERHLHSINYLGPLRSAPQRLYRYSNDFNRITGVTGARGEYSASALYGSSSGGTTLQWNVKNDVSRWFEKFEIPYELEIIHLGDADLAGEYITIALRDKRSNTWVTLADVGYGISQLLPVIIEGVASQDDSILCVEEPETNLHPRLQAKIPDLMIDTIADEPGKRKQWVVETHSELLVRRIQTRIAQGDISPSDVSVIYVDPDDDDCEGSSVKQLRLDENGYWLDEWPQGFFEDGYKQTRLARTARRNGKNLDVSKIRD